MIKHTHQKEAQPGLTSSLISWYHKNARQLPWRETTDPYAIWVSEVMLQQTRVETVIPYYQRFLKLFPTVTALAAASEQEVIKVWEGLGYYRRARLFIQGAKEVVSRFDGKLPADPIALAALPGVGAYMSGSLASIAFNLPVPAVDGNVIRFVTRILAWEEVAGTASSQQLIRNWVQNQFSGYEARDFTQALMELGALICLPRSPHCSECPVVKHCQAAGDQPERFPVKKAPKKIPSERRIVLRISWNGQHLLLQRPLNGLMAGFWEYPSLIVQPDEDALAVATQWMAQWDNKATALKFYRSMTHGYTHLRWDLEIFDLEFQGLTTPEVCLAGVWFSPNEEKSLPRVAFIRKLDCGK